MFQKSVLLYNTINGAKLLYESDNQRVFSLIKSLKQNNYVIKVSAVQIKKKEIKKFVTKVKSNFFGDIIDSSSVKTKPFIFSPILSIQKDKNIMKHDKVLLGHGAKAFINEITFYLNSNLNTTLSLYNNAYKQFPCLISDKSNDELSYKLILSELEYLINGSLKTINICGGEILYYSNLTQLVDKLNELPQIKKYYLHISKLQKATKFINSLSNNSKVIIIIDSKSLLEEKEILLKGIINSDNLLFQVIVSNENDLEIIDKVEAKYPDIASKVLPYWSGKNIIFFRKNVFTNKTNLHNSKPSQVEIFQKMEINTLNFGKVTVLNNRKLYTNLNRLALGEFGKKNLAEMVQKELKSKNLWFLTREYVNPCRSCIYNILCPSISNYEIEANKYNMCTVTELF